MKSKARSIVTILLVIFFVGSTALIGKPNAADKIEFTATETFDPFGLSGPPVGTFISPGTATCPGFEPTGDPLLPCPPESRTHIRGTQFISRVESSDPRNTGDMTVELNANYDANFTGPVWGTYSLALDAGGTWDGTFEGRRVKEGDHWVIPAHISGQGTGGAIDGMHVTLVDRIIVPLPTPVFYTGTLEGRMIDPN